MKERKCNMSLNSIAYNAISHMLCESEMTIEEICDYIGCTKEDLLEYDLIDEEE
jgi:hypothetical protein